MFDGKEKTNVEEYCVSEGWIRVAAGNAKDRFGQPMTIKLKGEVAPFLRGFRDGRACVGIGRDRQGPIRTRPLQQNGTMRARAVTVPQRSSALLPIEQDRAGLHRSSIGAARAATRLL